MGQPVQQRRGELGVAEHGRPLTEAQVGADHDAGACEDARRMRGGILWFGLVGLAQPLPDGVAGQPGPSRPLPQRQHVAEMHQPHLGQHAHTDHPLIPCAKRAQGGVSGGSVLGENQVAKWVIFGGHSTAS